MIDLRSRSRLQLLLIDHSSRPVTEGRQPARRDSERLPLLLGVKEVVAGCEDADLSQRTRNHDRQVESMQPNGNGRNGREEDNCKRRVG